MPDIQNTIGKLQSASKLLESISDGSYDNIDIESLKDILSKINDSVEELKQDVKESEDSLIRYQE